MIACSIISRSRDMRVKKLKQLASLVSSRPITAQVRMATRRKIRQADVCNQVRTSCSQVSCSSEVDRSRLPEKPVQQSRPPKRKLESVLRESSAVDFTVCGHVCPVIRMSFFVCFFFLNFVLELSVFILVRCIYI